MFTFSFLPNNLVYILSLPFLMISAKQFCSFIVHFSHLFCQTICSLLLVFPPFSAKQLCSFIVNYPTFFAISEVLILFFTVPAFLQTKLVVILYILFIMSSIPRQTYSGIYIVHLNSVFCFNDSAITVRGTEGNNFFF